MQDSYAVQGEDDGGSRKGLFSCSPTKLRPRVQYRSPGGTAPQGRHPSSPPTGRSSAKARKESPRFSPALTCASRGLRLRYHRRTVVHMSRTTSAMAPAWSRAHRVECRSAARAGSSSPTLPGRNPATAPVTRSCCCLRRARCQIAPPPNAGVPLWTPEQLAAAVAARQAALSRGAGRPRPAAACAAAARTRPGAGCRGHMNLAMHGQPQSPRPPRTCCSCSACCSRSFGDRCSQPTCCTSTFSNCMHACTLAAASLKPATSSCSDDFQSHGPLPLGSVPLVLA
jgi:hypothetical protein